VSGSSWQGINSGRPTPAEPNVPSTSLGNIPNGGKAAGSTPQFGLGPARKVQRLREMGFNASSSVSQKTEVFGALASYLETTLLTLPSAKALLIASTQYWYDIQPEAIPPSASNPTTRVGSDGKAKP
jgi:hypothetical protein